MARFKDNKGREWVLSLDIDIIEQCRDAVGLDLMGLDGGASFQSIPAFIKGLWVLCHEQADAAKIPVKDFYHGLVGDAIDAAREALLEAIRDFLPKADRTLFDQAASKVREATALAYQTVGKRVDSLSPESLVAAAEKTRPTISGAPSTARPESSASLPVA